MITTINLSARHGLRRCFLVAAIFAGATGYAAPVTTADGAPAELAIRTVGEKALRVTLTPLEFEGAAPQSPGVVDQDPPRHRFSLREFEGIVARRMGNLYVTVTNEPLAVDVSTRAGRSVQNIVFTDEGSVSFRLDDQPVLGLGQGGPSGSDDGREHPPAIDRRGHVYEMAPGGQHPTYGTRNPVPLLTGTSGWALYMATPRVHVDLRNPRRGLFIPGTSSEGTVDASPADNPSIAEGVFDFFLFDAGNPEHFMHDLARVSGKALLPPKWALGYLQALGPANDEQSMLDLVEAFRGKRFPLDGVMWLGNDGATGNPNAGPGLEALDDGTPEPEPEAVIADLHRNNVKVVLQVVAPDDEVSADPGHGSQPPVEEGSRDAADPWQWHVPLLEAGIDAFWAAGGKPRDVAAQAEWPKMHYQGAIDAQPNRRPWSLHSNGHLGIARWGGWLHSGETASAWRALEAQVTVGLNHSLSLSPWWGSDIGGAYPDQELTAELYARWFQFSAFTPLFLSHGRPWWMRLPWAFTPGEAARLGNGQGPLPGNLENAKVEEIARRYAQLRYRLLPYTYTLAWQAHADGLPLMRALWLHYPDDRNAAQVGSEYLWGRDLLVAPVVSQGSRARDVYLPPGIWYDWWNNERLAGSQTITRVVNLEIMPIYARAGAIIPLDPVRQHTEQRTYSPTTLKVFRGDNGEFILYDDDGTSRDYLDGEATLTRIIWDDAESRLTMEPAVSGRPQANRRFLIELIPGGQSRRLTYLGRRVTIDFSN